MKHKQEQHSDKGVDGAEIHKLRAAIIELERALHAMDNVTFHGKTKVTTIVHKQGEE